MNRLRLILLGICFVNGAYAQYIFTRQNTDNYWFKGVYEDSVSKNLYITASLIKSTPGYLNTTSNIFKLDKNGVLLDSIKIDSNLMVNAAITKIGNNHYIHGSQAVNTNTSAFKAIPVIYKCDQNFNIIKKLVLDSNFVSDDALVNAHLLQKNNRLYIAFALMNYSTVRLFKLDFNLNKLDSLTFNGSFTCDLANYGNRILLSGAGFPSMSLTGKNQVAELDTSFNVLSRFNLDSVTSVNPGCFQKVGVTYGHTNLYELSSNRYLMTGYSKVTYNSSCQWYIKNTNAIIKNNSIIEKSNIIGKPGAHILYTMPYTSSHKKYNYIFTTGMYGYNYSNPYPPQSAPTEIMVNKIDTAANLIWVNYYSTPNYYYSPLGVTGTSDSGCVVTGMRYNLLAPAVANTCEGFVLKLDKNGVIQYTGINDKDIIQKPIVNIYPNPASKEITLEVNSNDYFELEIYNSIGELVKYETRVKEKTTINTEGLPQGLYHFKLQSNKNNYSGKFIKQ
ncbi:MAG: T9SS type A sorting domain-containing protein [Bacteroidia bacterium]|nr:T9SS type A sorting domain-containing protein [Bacteroidia bacterium]